MKPRILLVDDDALLLRAMRRALQEDFEVVTAETGTAGLQALATPGGFAVVVSDFRMPGMDGIHFLDLCGLRSPDTIRIMLTGQADLDTAIEAVNKDHVFRFLTKPINGEELLQILRGAVAQFELIAAERILLEQTLTGSIQALVGLLALFDPSGFGRTREVRELALALAARLGVETEWEIGLAAQLTRVGWLAVPSEVQAKIQRGDRLSPQERDTLVRAPEIGAELIAHIPRLQGVARMLQYSHKWFNGYGYPRDRVVGTELPLGARILRVAQDCIDAQRLHHPQAQVISDLERGSGTSYDPAVLQALKEVLAQGRADTPDVKVPLGLEELEPGMTIGEDVYAKDGQALVLAMGTRLNQVHIEWLRNYSAATGLAQPVQINRMV